MDPSTHAGTTVSLDSAEGWRNVAVGFVAMFVVFGVMYSFGAFFQPMAAEFGAGSGATSAVFSLTAFCYFMLGSVTGRLADRLGPRPVLLAGAAAMGAGLLLTAHVDRLWLGYLTYGLGVGIGIACGYVPMVAVVSGWFERRRGTALGVAVAGIGVGTLAVAPLAAVLINRYGWRTTYLLFAAASLVLLLGCALTASTPPRAVGDDARRPLAALVRSRDFAVLYASTLLISLALFVPFVFLPAFAVDQGASRVAGASLIGVIGMASVGGRLLLGSLADRIGRVRVYQACFAVMAVSFALWLVATTYPWLVAFALLLGVGYGGFVALSPAVIADLFGAGRLGGIVGLQYTSAGLGALIGPPAAGFMIDATASHTPAVVAALLAAAGSFAVLMPLRDGRPGVARHRDPLRH
jgi:MFS family permease